MISAAVISTGRSGTNLVLEMLAANSYFIPTDPPEMKDIFYRGTLPTDRFLTKSDTWYCRSHVFFTQMLKMNPSLKIVWSIRHPYDTCMSKIYRGRNTHADDASFEGCIADMYHMLAIYQRVRNERIAIVRMEDTIRDIEKVAKDLCNWLGVEFEEAMKYPYKNMRHAGKKERYDKLDTGQIDMWRRKDEIYDGFFKDIEIEQLFRFMKPIIDFFGYEEMT